MELFPIQNSSYFASDPNTIAILTINGYTFGEFQVFLKNLAINIFSQKTRTKEPTGTRSKQFI